MTMLPGNATLPIIGWIDEPASEGIVGPAVRVTGWALAASLIRAVELRMDGLVLTARFGLPRRDVADVRPGYPDNPNSGFEFDVRLDAHPAPPGVDRRRMTIVAVARDGSEALLGERTLVESRVHARWRFATRDDVQPFYLLPAVSGVATGGAHAMNTRYAAYTSSTLRTGMRVPILYLRTTLGAAGDYGFDADFDVARQSANRPVADDSLANVLAQSLMLQVPVLVTLNGGIWSDAGGTAPAWDLTDKLEEDRANCQWNERDEVMADDYLKDLPGSHAAPELARALTLNVYAENVRRFKKRNLQQAAQPILAFMREHPDLFVGVNLDPDVYINPFFAESQWYDYNPGTLRQFREWLQGAGPYGVNRGSALPDLVSLRRNPPLSLDAVSRLARRTFATWDDVDPPRVFPRSGDVRYWDDPWVREWETFRRHLVSLHYTELAQWLVEAGLPSDRIWSSQGLMAPADKCMPLALRVTSAVKNYDSGGVSIEGSKPRAGHLGAILYGDAATNSVAMENGSTLFATLAAIDAEFAIVELNTADLRHPRRHPTYADAYRAWRDVWNTGARFVSPMAWNGADGAHASDAGYVTFTAWRNTPLEEAARDFMLARSGLPRGTKLWTFGTQAHADDDGWTADAGALTPSPGALTLDASWRGVVTLHSPRGLALPGARIDGFVVGVMPDAGIARIEVAVRSATSARWQRMARCAGRAIEWVDAGAWLRATQATAAPVDQLRIVFDVARKRRITLTRVAILMR
jgi:hypothetical protein